MVGLWEWNAFGPWSDCHRSEATSRRKKQTYTEANDRMLKERED